MQEIQPPVKITSTLFKRRQQNLTLNNIAFTVTSSLSKKKVPDDDNQENVTYNQEENSSIETNSKMTDTMELADKDLMIDIIKIKNILINLKEDLDFMRETEDIKTSIGEKYNTWTENFTDRIKRILDITS